MSGRLEIICLCLLLQDTQPDDGPVVKPMSGKVSVWRKTGDKIETVEKEARVSPDDRLGTPNGEVAKFSTEGSLVVLMKGIKVGPDRGMSLTRSGKKLVVQVVRGSVVLESYESEIEVVTPHGKAGGKSVYFIATVEEDKTTVVALEGKVTFSNDLGEVTVDEGESSTAGKGKAPQKPRPTVASETEWVRDEGNLIPNPGFEDGLDGWEFRDPPLREDAKVARGGRKSARATLNRDSQSIPVLGARTVKGVLKPGTKYLFRFYVRTEGYARDGKPVPLKLGIDRTGKASWADTKFHFEFEPSESDWAARRFTFEATTADLSFEVFSATERGLYTGTIWFDDFYLAEFPR